MGGSLGIDLRQTGSYTVLGISRQAATCREAIERGVVDDASVDLQLMAKADVVFLCTPLGAIVSTFTQLLPYLSPETVVTDIGSVKQPIVEAIAPQWQNFVGGHPMAGTTESGLDAALSGLFVDKPYVLTPTAATPPTVLEKVESIVRSLRARIYHCPPKTHDQAVAWISHLPVMVSASLIAACSSESDPQVLDLAQKLASSGFRDTSRVGGGNPELGLMMAQYNRLELLRSLHAYRNQLDQFITQIQQEDWRSLELQLMTNPKTRSQFVG